MRKCLLFTSLVVLILTSCQKSIVWDDLILTPPVTPPVTPTPSGSNLLDKIVALTTTDTLTYSYTYDNTKRLIKVTQVGVSSRDKIDETEFYIRDNAGKLIQHTTISYSATSTLPSKYDTIYAKIHYPQGSSNFDYVIHLANNGGGYTTDSVLYTYTNNKISQYKNFSTSLTSAAIPFYSVDIAYDALGNVTLAKYYSFLNSSTPTLSLETSYTYDSKVSPLIYGNESFIALGEYYAGPNNFLSLTVLDKVGTASALTVTYNRAYNSNNLPSTANGIAISNGQPQQTSQLTYFYK